MQIDKYLKEKLYIEKLDALCFSMLSYLNFSDFIGKSFKEIEDIVPQYYFNVALKSFKLWKHIKKYSKYEDVKVLDFKKDKTFSYLILNHNNEIFIAIRGTVSGISDWKEDFEISYKKVDSYYKTKEILENVKHFEKLIVCGHSKGGHLAMIFGGYASKYGIENVSIYNFDGPGFVKEKDLEVNSFSPTKSIVGTLFTNKNKKFVKTTRFLIMRQHLPIYWKISKDLDFVYKKQSFISRSFENIANDWIDKTSIEDRKYFVDIIFAPLEESEIRKKKCVNGCHITKPKICFIDACKSYSNLSSIEKKFLLRKTIDFKNCIVNEFTN